MKAAHPLDAARAVGPIVVKRRINATQSRRNLELIRAASSLGVSADIRNQGTVVSVTDGIDARARLSDAMQGECWSSADRRRHAVVRPGAEPQVRSVGAVILGEYERASPEERHREVHGRILQRWVGPELSSAAWWNALGIRSAAAGSDQRHHDRRDREGRSGVIARKSIGQPQTGLKAIDSVVPSAAASAN
jgi:F-type H+-transporting ATPase subunit alpha